MSPKHRIFPNPRPVDVYSETIGPVVPSPAAVVDVVRVDGLLPAIGTVHFGDRFESTMPSGASPTKLDPAIDDHQAN